MKKKPLTLIVLSWCLVAVAVSPPLQIMAIYGHGPDEMLAVINKITYLNWIVMGVCLANAILINRGSPWVRFSIPVAIGFVTLNNWVVGNFATDFSPQVTWIATGGFVLLNLPLLQPRLLRMFKNPALRWWMHAVRKRVHVPVFVGISRDTNLRAQTFDLSETGVFIRCPLSKREAQNLKTEGRINLSIALGVHNQIRCYGRIIRHSEAKGAYPDGIGIQFMDLNLRQRMELRKFLGGQPELSP